MSEPLLSVDRLIKRFGGLVATNNLSLDVEKGELHALIGPNGAGKTTFFNLLTKFLPPTSGTILYNGQDITHDKPADVARRGIIRSFQISAVFPNLTVLENVRIALQRNLGTSFHFWKAESTLDALNDRALAIARRIVEDHGGAFHVDSEVGTGSAFTVFLPIPPVGLS